MAEKYKIIAAHPDDEVLFFNSILENAESAIICFGPSANRTVSEGREKLRKVLPFENVKFLWIKEADVLDPKSFSKQAVAREGLTVSRNADHYRENFDKLVSYLRIELSKGDTVFTHNPWGEYGHEEHVQVFNAVLSLKEELCLDIYVSSYASNRSWSLMKERRKLLGREVILGHPNQEYGERYMDLFIKTNCWTWPAVYTWPSTELFYSIRSETDFEDVDDTPTAYLPLNMLSWNFIPEEQNRAKILMKKMVPLKIKKLAKSFFQKGS